MKSYLYIMITFEVFQNIVIKFSCYNWSSDIFLQISLGSLKKYVAEN